ncbi:hypothetical protein [Oceanicella actignis]|uniref:hypothetical protein n=1 Tax=Oceanicella actignis TaxID=1189325 RepID=UPI0011E71C29|nr:hypothetical protein [Oceanicella actignis]TYO83757.1 hypothetical protein LY05_02994 [Oceanicella actignis]
MTGAAVLIGFAEALAAPEVVFSLIGAGLRVRVFTRRGSQCVVARHLPVGPVVEITPPEDSASRALDEMCAVIADEGGPGLVMALDDVSLWLLDAVAGRLGVETEPKIVNPVRDQAAMALDKRRQVELAGRAGFRVAETLIAETREDIPEALALPAIVRPALAVQERQDRVVKGDVRYLLDQADLAALRRDRGLCLPLLIQPMIRGVGEGIFGFCGPEGPGWWSGHRRVRMMNPHGSGSSACMVASPEPDLVRAAARFVSEAGWRGPFMIELLRDRAGVPWFVEFNGRPWGSMALARRAGFEYPAWAVQQALSAGFRPPDVSPRDPGIVRHLGRELVHLAFVLKGPKSEFHRDGWPSFAASLRGVLAPAPRVRFYNYDPAFPRFFLQDAAQTVASFFRRQG